MMKCVTLAPNLSLTLTNTNPKKALKKFHGLSAGPQMTVTRTQAPVASAPSACDSRLSSARSSKGGWLSRYDLFSRSVRSAEQIGQIRPGDNGFKAASIKFKPTTDDSTIGL